jgi:phosphoenolpyruvate carboxykinase (ATP)
VLNTGSVGDVGKPIEVEHTISILVAVARGGIEWTREPTLDLDVPEHVPGTSIGELRPADHCEEYGRQLAELREERREYLAGFETLREDIRESVY